MPSPNDYVLVFNGDKILENHLNKEFILPYRSIKKDHLPSEKNCFFIGEYDGKKIFSIACNQTAWKKEFSLIPVRDALSMSDQRAAALICRSKHLLNWHQTSLYSGCCGALTTQSPKEIAKVCSTCERTIYPTYSNFVIVLIEKKDKILLARSPHFPKGVYSTIAGFVDAGESFEDTVHREVQEELGITVKNPSYFGSQSWPFPASIASAFIAKYEAGEISIDPNEIEDAQWFALDRLPTLPHPCSISRWIIDFYIRTKQGSGSTSSSAQ